MKEEMFCSFFIRFWASAGPVSAASNASSPSPVGVAVYGTSVDSPNMAVPTRSLMVVCEKDFKPIR